MPVEPGKQPALVLVRKLMFPHTNDAPALRSQGAGDEPVAGLVGGDFLPPESGVAFRLDEMLRAAVPETSIHKHREFPCPATCPS